MSKATRFLEDLNTLDKETHFRDRTLRHIALVQKYLAQMILMNDYRLDRGILTAEMNHDHSKFEAPEYPAYVEIDHSYNMKGQGKEYTSSSELQDLMDKASDHHVHFNPHHPEYWSKERAPEGTTIDCTSMPLSYIASMCADWLAMSEELKNSAIDWADKNVNKKWIFSDKQVELIYYLLKK